MKKLNNMKKITLSIDEITTSIKMMLFSKLQKSYTFEIISEECFLCELTHEKITANKIVVASFCDYELEKSAPRIKTKFN
jgi:hypothetical protein